MLPDSSKKDNLLIFNMTPEQKYIQLIISHHLKIRDDVVLDINNIDEVVDFYLNDEKADLCDSEEVIRQGQWETDIEADWSRHYESKSVAAQALDSSFIGWTFWYGGGKHGCPREMGFDIYDLDCVEEEKLVTIRTFSKK